MNYYKTWISLKALGQSLQVLMVNKSMNLNLLIFYNEHDLELIQRAKQRKKNLKAPLRLLKESNSKRDWKYLNLI